MSLSEGIRQNFAQWQKIHQELFANHPLVKKNDQQLIKKAIDVLAKESQKSDWQFQHGHFSARDIIPQGNQFVLLSNLYWSWKLPYYDAIFAFHWYQFDLANNEETTIELLDQQRQWWKKAIKNTIGKQTNEEKRRLELAFLERATAGLNLDGLIQPTAISEWLLDKLRQEIQELI